MNSINASKVLSVIFQVNAFLMYGKRFNLHVCIDWKYVRYFCIISLYQLIKIKWYSVHILSYDVSFVSTYFCILICLSIFHISMYKFAGRWRQCNSIPTLVCRVVFFFLVPVKRNSRQYDGFYELKDYWAVCILNSIFIYIKLKATDLSPWKQFHYLHA